MAYKFYSPLLETMATKYSEADFCYIVNRFKDPCDINRIKDINCCYFFLLAESNLLEEFGSLSATEAFTFFNDRVKKGRQYLTDVVLSNLAECGYSSKIEMAQHRLMTLIFIKTFLKEKEFGTLDLCPF